ncbi:MAG: hypothetical protein ACI4V7_00045 [Succinivibrionaceae bacterium]
MVIRKPRKANSAFRQPESLNEERREIRKKIKDRIKEGEDIRQSPFNKQGCNRCLICDGKCVI